MEAPAGALDQEHPAKVPPPLAVDLQNQGSDAEASSGKSSQTTSEGLVDPAAAAAAPVDAEELTPTATAEQEAQQASPVSATDADAPGQAEPELPQLSPLPPPDASEGPEVVAEYQAYLQRWEEGQTLAQRWHRLAQSGKLADIRAEWDDWQLDLMLTQVRARTAAAIKEQGKAAATGFGGAVICSTRLRRGRGEVQEAEDSPSEEPRRVRSRRAPSTLQDFHVDAAAANKTPERTPDAYDPAAAAAVGSYRQQQLMPAHQGAAEPTSEESTDEAEPTVAGRAQQQQQQALSAPQQQQQRPPGRRGPLPQQPLKRVVTRVQRSSGTPQQQAQHSRQFNRVITPYNPQLHQQQQMQAQMMHAMQQEQQQVAAAAAMAGVSPAMLDEFYAMGSRLGAAFGQGEGGPAGGLAQNPVAMQAFMHALYQYGANPAALAQQVEGHQ